MPNNGEEVKKPDAIKGKTNRFIPYHYSVQEQEWPNEMFFRELEIENPNLMNIPYYTALRSSLREKADSNERMTNIPVSQILNFQPRQKPLINEYFQRAGNYTLITPLEMRLSVLHLFLEQPKSSGEKWLIGAGNPIGVSFYRYIHKKGKISREYYLNKRDKTNKIVGKMVYENDCNHFILRLDPLILAWFDDPRGNVYTVMNYNTKERYQCTNLNALLPVNLGIPQKVAIPRINIRIDMMPFSLSPDLNGYVYGPNNSIYLDKIMRERRLKVVFLRVRKLKTCSLEQLYALSKEFNLDPMEIYNYVLDRSDGWAKIEKPPSIITEKVLTPVMDIINENLSDPAKKIGKFFHRSKPDVIIMPKELEMFLRDHQPNKNEMRVFKKSLKEKNKLAKQEEKKKNA